MASLHTNTNRTLMSSFWISSTGIWRFYRLEPQARILRNLVLFLAAAVMFLRCIPVLASRILRRTWTEVLTIIGAIAYLPFSPSPLEYVHCHLFFGRTVDSRSKKCSIGINRRSMSDSITMGQAANH
jgi:hypothetical protein